MKDKYRVKASDEKIKKSWSTTTSEELLADVEAFYIAGNTPKTDPNSPESEAGRIARDWSKARYPKSVAKRKCKNMGIDFKLVKEIYNKRIQAARL